MLKCSNSLILMALAATLSTTACKKDAPKADKEAVEAIEKAPAEAAPKVAAVKPEVSSDATFAQAVMAPYETCRALLAGDSTEGISECASAVASAAKAAEASAPEASKASLGQVATTAAALSKVGSDDIAALRLGFGDMSKPIVAMLTSAPESAKHYHLYECPMAKGYKKWAQPNAGLNNPYMGAKMLECGSEVHDHHEGLTASDKAPKSEKLAPEDDHGHQH